MELAYYILKKLKKKGADDVIVGINKLDASQIKFSNNKIVKTGSEILVNLEIFMAKNKRIIVTSLKDFNKEPERQDKFTSLESIKSNVDKVINNLTRFSNNLEPNKNYNGIAQGPFKYKEVKENYDKKIKDMDEVDLMQNGINAALENADRSDGIFEKNIIERFLLTSNNVEAEEKSTALYFSIRSFKTKDASGHMNSCSSMLSKLDVYGAGKTSGEIAKQARNPEEGKAGKYDVVFSYMPMAALLNEIMDASSIFAVESGLSFLRNKLNKNIGNFNLIDQGDLKNGFNSCKFDDEGTPTKKNYIIKNGILKTYLHNTSSSRRYKVKNTGNAGLISPEPFNIIFEGERGDIFNIKKGLYITNVWYTRFQNYLTGEFSTIPRDGIFLIKNGEITKSIKDIRVSDNFPNIMKNISLAGKKSKQLKSWEAETPVTTPEVLIKNVNISKAKL